MPDWRNSFLSCEQANYFRKFIKVCQAFADKRIGGGGRMQKLLRAFLGDESGQDLIEYALVAAILALAAVAGMSTLASNISNAFSTVSSSLSSAIA